MTDQSQNRELNGIIGEIGCCYIFGGGNKPISVCEKKSGDLVLCADSGYETAKDFGMEADAVLGDFDSMQEPENDEISEKVRYPVEKDDTDMALCVHYGFDAGYRRFVLYGGTGGRVDHTMANWQLLAGICRRGGIGFLVGDGYTATVISNEEIVLPARNDGIFSCFSLTGTCKNVNLTGLQYPLDGYLLTCERAIGVSNHFIGREARVSVGDGLLLCMWEGENCFPDLKKR